MEHGPVNAPSAFDLKPRLRVLAVCFLATVAVGFRHIPRVDPDQLFFLDKYEKPSAYNVLLLGDSRVFVGLDPGAFDEAIPSAKCLNFGFAALGYSNAYFDRVEQILSHRSARPLVVLAVDASALTDLSAGNNAFTDVARMTPLERFQLRLVGPNWKEPDPIRRPHRFTDNGWIPVTGIPFNPSESLDIFARQFRTARCSDAVLSTVAKRIRRWRSQGIQVLALRMPTSRDVYRLECDLIGYRPDHVRRALTEAGATWLDLPPSDTDSYDGSHLGLAGSQRISAVVSRAAARLIGP
ncbi:MAG: hypothetical protein P4L46_19390 [Fimbriimonas sp.]|nr:hypothetical protein [Fimbriimonas sp.]